MSNKASLTPQQIVTNKFAFCLLKHFHNSKIKVQDSAIKIQVDQLCGQDFAFIMALSDSVNKNLGINVCRSGKGLSIILGVAKILEMPDFLIQYKRGDGKIIEN